MRPRDADTNIWERAGGALAQANATRGSAAPEAARQATRDDDRKDRKHGDDDDDRDRDSDDD